MGYPVNEIVEEIGKINFQGNVFPESWSEYLVNSKGKLQLPALHVLAEIVYWYRPIPVYDISTGKVIKYQKKFKEDVLQKSYKELEKKLHLTKNQIRNALVFLEEKKLVEREFRDIVCDSRNINTVMYLHLNVKKLAEITRSHSTTKSIEIIDTAPSIKEEEKATELAKKIECSKENKETSKTDSQYKWIQKFSDLEKKFFYHLIAIKPPIGEGIKPGDASWWIKEFGYEKVNDALNRYAKQVKKAKKDTNVEMPRSIGGYMRKILNKDQEQKNPNQENTSQKKFSVPLEKLPRGGQKNVNPNTKNSSKTSSSDSKVIDWSMTFSVENKKFYNYLINIVPEKGDPIEPKEASYWVKHFGIEKIKVALQVYWQQVNKAKKDTNIEMPRNIGKYVRNALNKGLKPCLESHKRNQEFAQNFKVEKSWSELTITQKYCRLENVGKEWHYNLSEELFKERLVEAYENFSGHEQRKAI